jgi:1-acyl-sn-glycerol-3-phosphate acyltransferase
VTRKFTPFYRFAARGVLIPFLKLVSRQHVEGLENLPKDGGFIVVANHLTDLDSLTAMRTLVDADIPVYSLAKASLFKVPVVGQVLAAGGQIPVQRGTAHATDALAEAAKRLQEGACIIIFPEGTLSRDPLKWPMVGKTGAARLAMQSGVPVIPMGQWGAHFILDTYSHHLKVGKRKDVRVKIGPALDLSQYGSDIEDRQKVRECTAAIMSAITRLVEDLRGEKAPRPYDMHYDGDPGKGKIGVRKPDPQN